MTVFAGTTIISAFPGTSVPLVSTLLLFNASTRIHAWMQLLSATCAFCACVLECEPAFLKSTLYVVTKRLRIFPCIKKTFAPLVLVLGIPKLLSSIRHLSSLLLLHEEELLRPWCCVCACQHCHWEQPLMIHRQACFSAGYTIRDTAGLWTYLQESSWKSPTILDR